MAIQIVSIITEDRPERHLRPLPGLPQIKLKPVPARTVQVVEVRASSFGRGRICGRPEDATRRFEFPAGMSRAEIEAELARFSAEDLAAERAGD